ncbi:MAG TPA: response regulator [Thermoanaerobaculia bacterium]|nr:response regulator [Thermoanaerobaculia bacterium]
MSAPERPAVLVVDDNEATCTLITAILQREFQVECSIDGGDALERLKTNKYAAILLDLRMPQPDGFSILDFLKANQPATLSRLIVVTAVLQSKEVDRAKSYGICGVVAKPFEVETLLDAVKRCVGDSDSGMRGTGVFAAAPTILLIADLLSRRIG